MLRNGKLTVPDGPAGWLVLANAVPAKSNGKWGRGRDQPGFAGTRDLDRPEAHSPSTGLGGYGDPRGVGSRP